MPETLSRSTSGSCAFECHRRKWCNSFLFTPPNNTCSLCSLHYLDGDVSVDNDVTRYYRAESGKMICVCVCSLHYDDGDVSIDDDVTRYSSAYSGEMIFSVQPVLTALRGQ